MSSICPFARIRIGELDDYVICHGDQCMMYGNYLVEQVVNSGYIKLIKYTGCTVGRRVCE